MHSKALTASSLGVYDAIINRLGEIYQYVGDEIIISWPLEKGLKDQNCIQCFREMRNAINAKTANYLQHFGLVPQFKAALHYGKVTTGEIGELKKEIVFTGDVVNTTSRIQVLCNDYQAELLISNQLLEKLTITDLFQETNLGELTLKGKHSKVAISKLDMINHGSL